MVTVDVFVTGKPTVHRSGLSIRSIYIEQLPKQRFTVRIVSTQSTGLQSISVRTYAGCIKGRVHTHGQRHKRH